jgi:hypothetical protein
LGTEGYSPAVLRLAVRQAGKAASFGEASDDLKHLARVTISPNHLAKLAERVGREWAAARDADVQAFRENTLAREYPQLPRVATVMVDGGRVQTRQESDEPGVTDPAWREVEVACCQTHSSAVHAVDPQPEPPEEFLDPIQVARLAAEIKARGGPSEARSDETAGAGPKRRRRRKACRGRRPRKRRRRRKACRGRRPRKLVRTVVASMANSEAFGWQMAAEVQRRGLDRARRKGYIRDGQRYTRTLFEWHLVASGFIGILDVVHLPAYLYGAACAVEGEGSAEAWALYECWLRLAWSGRVTGLLAGLRAGRAELGPAPSGCSETDPRQVAADAWRYVESNRSRMDYPQYRRLGLPISSASVESVMKQVNRRMKGTEKFWLGGGAGAMLQVRAAYLSEDGRSERYWSRPRPLGPAVGTGRLRPAA